ncbi:glycosyltransferase involved in cell wall biosynthesis [Cryobacterium sp. MP_M3]|uniref:glycosyltransferase n=1 Tax=unclassified Cryobacterium TaxID=2649013 RepID=UPI001A18718E|nr:MULTISPECIES: glycosyltransferase [unclassified Cryobacterium]MBG6058658.1 glycosyltransferase involved in cell wall biosynthesis [Cryobacterium sp. MP_M3]
MSKSVVIIGTRGYPSYYGGFETAVRKIAPFLADKGWDVTVYGRPGATSETDPERDSRIQTVTTWGFETKSVSTLSYGLSACLSATRRRPDVALVMNVANGYFLPFLHFRRIPTLVNVDGIEWERAKWGRLAKSVFRTGARLAARFGTRMVYDSHEIAVRWREDFGLEGDFIPYGGDVVDVLPLEPGLAHRGYVLVVARFVPENTIPEFLEASVALSKLWPVVIVGSSGYGGPIDERARVLAANNAGITWLGHISDDRRLLSLWQHAGVYFHGHSVGGTNPTLVQAMATATPIVARDTPYNREVLGEQGIFCAPTPDQITLAIGALMADPTLQERQSAALFARARERYTWEGVCQAYDFALTRLIAQPRIPNKKKQR